MLIHEANSSCPECGAGLESGFISYGSGLLWHDAPLRGLKRLFPYAFATGQGIVGSFASTGLMTSRPGKRCPACHTFVVLNAEVSRNEPGDSRPAA